MIMVNKLTLLPPPKRKKKGKENMVNHLIHPGAVGIFFSKLLTATLATTTTTKDCILYSVIINQHVNVFHKFANKHQDLQIIEHELTRI